MASTIPTTRAALLEALKSSYAKLRDEIETGGPRLGSMPCVDSWTVKDLLSVRVWWTNSVIDWVEAGCRGEQPVTPSNDYRWNETPRLNEDIVRSGARRSYRSICEELTRGYHRVLATVESISDRELLEVGVFPWAGKYPVARWIAMNTSRQYQTARTHIRRAKRDARG